MNLIKKIFSGLTGGRFFEEESGVAREYLSFERAKLVGILFTSKNLQSIEVLTDFIKRLQQEGKQVKALTYYNTKEKDGLKVYNFNHHAITEKDVGKNGEVKSFLADDFINSEFDYLFCIEVVSSDVFKNILQRSRAKCRIGKYTEGQMNYELMIKIDDSEGTDALIKQMDHYVKTIKNDEK